MLAALEIPDHVYELHVWADSDENGITDAYKLKARYEDKMDVIVHTPPEMMDWNDALIKQGDSEIVKILDDCFI